MLTNDRTDPQAAHHAEHLIRDVLDRAEVVDSETDDATLPLDYAAEQVTGAFAARFECRDGLRRVVLTGQWEVDPAAVTIPVPLTTGGGASR